MTVGASYMMYPRPPKPPLANDVVLQELVTHYVFMGRVAARTTEVGGKCGLGV
jgi:hypothetical protein